MGNYSITVKNEEEVRQLVKYKMIKLIVDNLINMGVSKKIATSIISKVEIIVGNEEEDMEFIQSEKFELFVNDYCRSIVILHETLLNDFNDASMFNLFLNNYNITVK